MTKRLTAFILMLLLIFPMAACGDEEPDTPQVQQPVDEPPPDRDDNLSEEPPIPYGPGSLPVEGYDNARKIKLDYLEEQGMTVDNVCMASEDIILVFASKLSSGTVSEQTWLYTYSVSRDSFSEESMPIGVIGQYPTGPLDDGRVVVLTFNSESYRWQDMFFIQPETLYYEKKDISFLEDGVRSVIVSPAGDMVAISDQNGIRVMDIDFENTIASFEGYLPEDGDPDYDFHLPVANDWDRQGGIVGGMLGYEWVYYPIYADISDGGGLIEYREQEYLNALPYRGGDILLFDHFTLAPYGQLDTGSDRPEASAFEAVKSYLPDEESSAYISAMEVNSRDLNGLYALALCDPGGHPTAQVVFFVGEHERGTFAIDRASEYPPSFERVSISPAGGAAAMMTSATVDAPKEIYYMTFE